MKFLFCLSSLSLALTPVLAATKPKANEYKSNDCTGSINYSHNSFDLYAVSMDDTSNSVYLTAGQRADGVNRAGWVGFSGKASGGQCTGSSLGKLPNGCISLHPDGKPKIQCVYDQAA